MIPDLSSFRRITTLVSILSFFFTYALAQKKAESALAREVSEERLLSAVRSLVRCGPRLGGTPSGEKSSAFIVSKFKEAGLKAIIQKDPAKLAFDAVGWTLHVEEPKSLRDAIKHEWLGGYSPTIADTTTELVLVQEPASISRNGLSGKAVLIPEYRGSREYKQLVTSGARCILLSSPKLEGAYSNWAMISDLPASEHNPIPLYNISSNTANRLAHAIKDSEDVRVSFSSRTVVDSARPKTVIATIEGESARYYLVCAHGDSDSGGPGADDNASGVSGVLELARTLNKLVCTHQLPRPKVSIRFAVWGSEMFSSDNYVRIHKRELDSIAGVINFDEIGTGATRNCLYFESNDIKFNERLLRTLEKVGEDYVGKRGFWEESTTNPSQGGTDSYVFLPNHLRSLGILDVRIPSVTVYTCAWNELKPLPQTPGWTSKAWHGPADTVYIDYSAYYHSSLDTPELTTEKEPFNMVGAVKAIGIALVRLAW